MDAFIEEAVIRRELADNFCFYNENYDSLKGKHVKICSFARSLNLAFLPLLSFNLRSKNDHAGVKA